MKKFVLVFCLLLALVCAFCACEEDVTPTPISVQSATINENGELVITLSDGTTHNVGVPTHSHSYGSYVDYSATNSTVSCDKRVYYRTCSGCGDIEWRTGGEHTFQTVTDAATCTQTGTETKTCTTCGKAETAALAIVPHSYETAYRYNGSHHWYKCADCDAITEKAEHTEGEDGLCTVCGEPTGPTEGIVYIVNNDHAEVLGYTGTATKIRIADTYEGNPVTVIGANAFKGKSITSIYLPEGITIIGNGAFSDCNHLTAINIPEGVTSIGENAFMFCGILTAINIPASVTSIGDDAFQYCYSLSSITFAENSQLTSIGSYAFDQCGDLTSITIPEGVTSIGYGAFRSCNLTFITIPASVTSIDCYAFYECDNLSVVTFAENSQLTSIGSYAFYNCSNLTAINIPASVTSIGSYAFEGCPKLTSVTFENKTGWRASGTAINADRLNDTALAATYLTATYAGNNWTRSDP